MAVEDYCQMALEHAADAYERGDRQSARDTLAQIVATPLTADAVDEIKAKETAIYRLASILALSRDGQALMDLMTNVTPFFVLMPKAKTTKMVRKLFEHIVQCGVPLEQQQKVCRETIQWSRQEKRTFLRHRIQLRLAEVQFEQRNPREALNTLLSLLREVRRLDDRTLLLDIHLLESKIYYSIRNSSKARAALVAARTTANSIYCPPLAQAEIDLQSGVLHAEERDPKTAYSYFYEAFEGFHQLGDQARQARRALRYMIVAKIATDMPDDLSAILISKNVLEYKGDDMEALRGIAEAYSKQDTHLFNEVLLKQQKLASSENSLLYDEVVRRQLEEMYDTLTERHLLNLIAPYQRVQIAYLASLLRLNDQVVENRISQLILDKKLYGIVDQQHNCLIVFDEVERKKKAAAVAEQYSENAADQAAADLLSSATLYQDALTAISTYDTLISALFDKVGGKFDALVEDQLAKRTAAASRNKEKDAERHGTVTSDKTAGGGAGRSAGSTGKQGGSGSTGGSAEGNSQSAPKK